MKLRRPVLNAHLCSAVLAALLLIGPAGTFAQENPDYEAEFKLAAQLVETHKMPEAALILEKLHAAKPNDAAVLELLSYTLFVSGATEKDAEKRKKDILRARSLVERAKELGRSTQLVQVLLEQIPADGNLMTIAASKKRSPAEEA